MKRVLLINDSKFEGIILKDCLSNLGYQVRISDEYSAEDCLQSFLPDFAITNYIMKETRGDELIRALKKLQPNIKCILSSSNDIGINELSYKNIDALIKTPIDRQQLAKIIEELVNKESKAQNERKPGDGVSKTAEANVRIKPSSCPNCNMTLDTKSHTVYVFCPYCGSKL